MHSKENIRDVKKRSLNVSFLSGFNKNTPLANVAGPLEETGLHKIDRVPWPDHAPVPDVQFSIAYTGDCVYLRYVVTERSFRATCLRPNEPVYTDSCVEFFVSFGNEAPYYNFEFNSLGTVLAGYGVNRHGRTPLTDETIKKIKSRSLITASRERDRELFVWEIVLMIPFDAFSHHAISTLKNKTCRANFHKCGDSLPEPHFVVWNDIAAETPDFHLSEFFGEIAFV